ncbi:MAG: penicillin-binding protein 2 [Candidatus Atribacteria bacterium]|nr:MAG: penicillin-binding protein 2 [Candidatus Atribacteria bacterium]
MYPSPPQTPNSQSRTTHVRGRVVLAIFAVLLAVVVGRFVQLQIVQHAYWLGRAQASQERIIQLPPQRGSILDRNGVALAIDVKAMAIAVDGINLTNESAAVTILVEELALPRSDVQEKVSRDSYFTWINRRVDFDTAQRIRERANAADVYGLVFIDTWKRWYPQGRLASNLIGFVGTDGAGLEGLEMAYDEQLQGTAQVIRVLEGADGRTYNIEVVEQGQRGKDLTLSIEMGLQFICEEEIRTGVNQFRALGGMIVLLDPHTGDVLAMAQDKGYDLNAFWDSTPEQRRNLAVTHLFEPGSIFKVFTGLAALENGVVSPADTFNGNDGIDVFGHVMHNADNESYGMVTFAEIIEHSINTGMIRVAQGLTEDQLHDLLAGFGFGTTTKVGLPGEERGILRPVADWSGLALAAHSIGQSVAVTGIQLARAVAVIASDGILRTPRIIVPAMDDVAPPDGVRVCSRDSANTMLALMRAVVESGTGTLAAIDGFAVAGKTGTAQKAVAGQGYVVGKYTSLFAGILDANSPDYVMVVVLDEVQSGSPSGGYTAGQIFRRAATRLIAHERLAPS